MDQNENGEFVTVRTYINEYGEKVREQKTYQDNGWVRINEKYPDGTTTEIYMTATEDAEMSR